MAARRWTGWLPAVMLVGMLAGPARPSPPAAPERPNLLFIYTDDQRWDAIGYRTPHLHTPNLDRLSLEGLRFNQASIVLPVCSPSRAAALTGRYGMANGVTTYRTPIGESEVTFAKHLREAGYLTAMVGKWHVPGRAPTEFEFDEVRDTANTGVVWQPDVMVNGVKRRAPGMGHDYLVDESIAIMRAARDRGVPFGIYLSTQEPHNKTFRGGGEERMDASVRQLYEDHPLSMMPVPPNIHDDLVGKPAYLNGYRGRRKRVGSGPMTPERYWECQYASFTMMTVLDRVLGRLFDALEAMELRGSTYIVFMSDNGLFQGEHGLMSKALHYEESVRVPLFVVGPGIAPGFDDRSLPTNVDIAPTLLDLAGLPVPESMHGTSLRTVLFDRTPLARAFVLLEHPDTNPTLEVRPAYSLRSRRWKHIRTYEDGANRAFTHEELYDLEHDPFEMANLAGRPEHGELLDCLRKELDVQRKRYAR